MVAKTILWYNVLGMLMMAKLGELAEADAHGFLEFVMHAGHGASEL